MSRLYLTELALTEFRSFSNLRVSLPPEPGVLIVHGTNGLGKSSLFDGLEWALAGEIDHFRDAAKATDARDYLRRWHAPNDRPTQVSLGFSDGEIISRSLGAGQQRSHGVASVTDYLRTPLWKPEIGDLHRYLLLTHFLGQSTLSRMTHRKPEERWEFLQQPAQSDWANKVAAALHGHGSSILARTYERKSKELSQEASQLEELLAREEAQWRESRAEGAVDEATAVADAQALFNQLTALAPWIGSAARLPPQDLSADGLIEALQAMVAHQADLAGKRESALARSRNLLAAQQRAQAGLTAGVDEVAAAQAQLSASEGELAAKAEDCEKRKLALATLEIQSAGNVAHLRRLSAVQGLRAAVTAARSALSQAQELTTQLAKDLELATIKVSNEERRRAIVGRLSTEIGGLANLTEHQATRLRRLDDLDDAERRRSEAAKDLEAAQSANDGIDNRLAAAEAEVEESRAAAEAAAAEFQQLRQSVDALSAAVSSVANHLSANECDCPVCATHFESAEELRSRAVLAAERLAPALATQEKRLSDARAVLTSRVTALAVLRDAQAETRAREQTLARATATRDEISRDLFEKRPFSVADLTQARSEVEAAIARHTSRRLRKEHWLEHPILGGTGGSLASWSLAIQQRNEIAVAVGGQTQRVSELSQAVRSSLGQLDVAEAEAFEGKTTADDALATLIAVGHSAQTEIKSKIDGAREELRLAEEAHDRCARSKAERTARFAEIVHAQESLANELVAVGEEWRSLGISPAPLSLEEVLRAERMLAEAATQRGLVEQRLRRLREGRTIWRRQLNHVETLERLREISGAAPNVDRDALRAQTLATQSSLVRKASAIVRAKSIAQKSHGEVTKAVEAFNREYLKPLNKLMNKLNRAILSEPDIGLDLRVGRKKVQQTAIKSPDAPAHVTKLDPQLVHSEGQMAALAVSMLCAASLTFSWSRWPGLVLDDPLQHNDVIHTAAFADMLCNLIVARKYQVFLSTHDLAQAEFLRRKFVAAGVPCTTLHLLGLGSTGIDTLTKRYAGRSAPGAASQAG